MILPQVFPLSRDVEPPGSMNLSYYSFLVKKMCIWKAMWMRTMMLSRPHVISPSCCQNQVVTLKSKRFVAHWLKLKKKKEAFFTLMKIWVVIALLERKERKCEASWYGKNCWNSFNSGSWCWQALFIRPSTPTQRAEINNADSDIWRLSRKLHSWKRLAPINLWSISEYKVQAINHSKTFVLNASDPQN